MAKKGPQSARRPSRWRVPLLLLCLIGVAAVAGTQFWAARRPPADEAERTKDRYAKVKRGSFNVTVNLDGNLDAIKRHMIKPDFTARFGLEIAFIIEDRTAVKAGDLVVSFTAEKYEQEDEKLRLDLDDESKNLRWAEEDLEMTRASNLNLIKIATDKLRDSREALDRYEEQDAPRKRRELTTAIETAELKVAESEDAVTAAKDELADARMADQSKVEAVEKKVDDAEKALVKGLDDLEKARYALRVFKQYDHPQKVRSLRETVTKNRMALKRELVDASGNVVKSQRQIQNHHTRIKQLETDLQRLRETMGQLRLTAPVDGIVSLGNPLQRPWRQPKEIKIGAQINRSEIIASIPDLSQFLVNVNVPEEFRSRLETGQRAHLRSKAIPDLILNGEVQSIAPMAMNVIQWDQNSPKIYPTEISTAEVDPRLMPGMTMRVEVIVEEVRDVLFVPIEAVYNRQGKAYCRVRRVAGYEERQVGTGRSSDSFVEILEGLSEADEVLLSREGI